METQKIVNILNDSENESSKFVTANGMPFMIKIVETLEKKMKLVQTLNLRQKVSNQVFAIIQMYIFL